MTYTPAEMMTVAAARALTNDDICFVGIGLPSAACNLARLTHAPRICLIYESGTLATRPEPWGGAEPPKSRARSDRMMRRAPDSIAAETSAQISASRARRPSPPPRGS